jgi:hypothetical protein
MEIWPVKPVSRFNPREPMVAIADKFIRYMKYLSAIKTYAMRATIKIPIHILMK